MTTEPPIEKLTRVRNSLAIISGRCWPECEAHVTNSIAILDGLIAHPTPDLLLIEKLEAEADYWRKNNASSVVCGMEKAIDTVRQHQGTPVMAECIIGLLRPIADREWDGKWRIQKAIAALQDAFAGGGKPIQSERKGDASEIRAFKEESVVAVMNAIMPNMLNTKRARECAHQAINAYLRTTEPVLDIERVAFVKKQVYDPAHCLVTSGEDNAQSAEAGSIPAPQPTPPPYSISTSEQPVSVSLDKCAKAATDELKHQMGGHAIPGVPEQVESWTAQGDVNCADFKAIAKAVLDAAEVPYVA
ncbi:hypothetical protein [Fimbriiglobus ruber]|uniref:hypothetical protein n=1 Tax=Fimbriiglobus ruber TaxID=1908690 RepID=UPI001179BD1F|nr:hypothetical protein [Fimbriiglobus ruber]